MQQTFPRLRAGGAVALALALTLGAACAGEKTTGLAADGADIDLVVVSGNNQSAAAGSELPQPLVVQAVNGAGAPIANQIINFVVTSGGGSVFAGTAKTNSSGYAREWWTLGPAAGANRVEARAVNASTGERLVFGVFDATGTSGTGGGTTPVLTTVTVTPDSSSVQVGATVQLAAALRDQNGAAMTGSVAWTSLNGATATVNGSGLVTGAAAGTARIVGSSGGKADTVKVVVTPPPPPPPPPPPASGRWISGYYVGYQRSMYPETQVDFSYITHIFMGAVQPTSSAGVTTDFYVGTAGPTMARTLATRAHQFNRKAILMLGGAGSHDLLVNATSSANRATFVANLLRTMDDLGYDGIDVDWEPIGSTDKPQLLQFLKDLRAARPGMLITIPVNWVGSNATPDPWYAQVAAVVDQINIMSYEMAGAWSGWVSWHHSALYGEGSNHPSSVSSNARVYLNAGVPAAKLGIGLATYGSCWRGVSAMLQPPGSGVVASDNTMTYAAIMSQYYSASAYRWDATARSGYLSFATGTGPQQCTMVSYEDPQSIAEKGAYVKSAGLGGAIVWTVQQGHLSTAPAGQQDPLLSAAYNAIVP